MRGPDPRCPAALVARPEVRRVRSRFLQASTSGGLLRGAGPKRPRSADSGRKFAPSARNYIASKLMAQVGLRVNEACQLDLTDVGWELGRFGKLHVRVGKGARGSGPGNGSYP